jgi:hypothetical protein
MTGSVRKSFGRVTGALAALAIAVCLPAAALAGEGPAPTIESDSVSHVRQNDATLEALIDPGSGEDGFSLATEYEFFLEAPWCGVYGPGSCEGTGGVQVSKGVIAAGSGPERVSVDLIDAGHELAPSTTYGYRVVARNGAGTRYGGEQTFTTPSGDEPVIEGASLLRTSPTDATLGARIDTEGLETKYEFLLWYSPCSKHGSGCEVLIDVPLPSGTLLGSFVGQDVSIDLNSAGVTLGEGEYGFSVKATNAAGGTSADGGVFEVPGGPEAGPPPPPPSPVPPIAVPPSTEGGLDQTQGIGSGQAPDGPGHSNLTEGGPAEGSGGSVANAAASSAASGVSAYRAATHSKKRRKVCRKHHRCPKRRRAKAGKHGKRAS